MDGKGYATCQSSSGGSTENITRTFYQSPPLLRPILRATHTTSRWSVITLVAARNKLIATLFDQERKKTKKKSEKERWRRKSERKKKVKKKILPFFFFVLAGCARVKSAFFIENSIRLTYRNYVTNYDLRDNPFPFCI